MVNPKQVTFRIPPELWQEFSIESIKIGKTKTFILVELIKKFLGKKSNDLSRRNR